jgi:hypothetical protein
MTNNRSIKLKLATIASILMMFALSACNKGLSHPESWNSSSLLMTKCDSSRAFSVKAHNEDRESKMQPVDVVVTKTSIDEVADSLSTTQGPIEINVDCKTLTATYIGPVAVQAVKSEQSDEVAEAVKNVELSRVTIAGDLVDIGVNSIKIKSKTAMVTIERVFPNKKEDRAGYNKAVQDEKNGISLFKITIEDTATAKVIVLKQEVGLEAI